MRMYNAPETTGDYRSMSQLYHWACFNNISQWARNIAETWHKTSSSAYSHNSPANFFTAFLQNLWHISVRHHGWHTLIIPCLQNIQHTNEFLSVGCLWELWLHNSGCWQVIKFVGDELSNYATKIKQSRRQKTHLPMSRRSDSALKAADECAIGSSPPRWRIWTCHHRYWARAAKRKRRPRRTISAPWNANDVTFKLVRFKARSVTKF